MKEHWVRGKYVTWDAPTIHTCAVSYIHLMNMLRTGSVLNTHSSPALMISIQ